MPYLKSQDKPKGRFLSNTSGTRKAQAALDFMMSYGIALIIIAIAITIVYKVSIQNPAFATPACSMPPGFTCMAFSMNSSGVLTLDLAQATGGPITVSGVACSNQINATGNKPKYGNIGMTANPTFYPSGKDLAGNSIYSGSGYVLYMNCYNNPNTIAQGSAGQGFNGYVWMNYTVPIYGTVKQVIATVTVKYS